jgi:hypothetical protein
MSHTINHPIVCCKGCVAPKRYPGCHSHCPEYTAEKAVYEAERAEAIKMKAVRRGLDAQAAAAAYRAKKIREWRK